MFTNNFFNFYSSRSRDKIIEGDWLYIGGNSKPANKKTEELTIEPIRMTHQAQSNIFMKNEPAASKFVKFLVT